jgi:hypothetical protein
MFSIFKRIKKLEDELKRHVEKTKRAFDIAHETDKKLSKWDDERHQEILALAEKAGLRFKKGTYVVPCEDDDE